MRGLASKFRAWVNASSDVVSGTDAGTCTGTGSCGAVVFGVGAGVGVVIGADSSDNMGTGVGTGSGAAVVFGVGAGVGGVIGADGSGNMLICKVIIFLNSVTKISNSFVACCFSFSRPICFKVGNI